jgi:quercetin dioxygenase-like cupin family protein
MMGLPPEHVIDIAAVLRQAGNDGPIWSITSEQLNVNLLRLPSGDGVAEHVNNEVDVLLVIMEGSGELVVDGVTYALSAGRALLAPRGARRRLHCTAGPLVYLTCHRRRGGLMPT